MWECWLLISAFLMITWLRSDLFIFLLLLQASLFTLLSSLFTYRLTLQLLTFALSFTLFFAFFHYFPSYFHRPRLHATHTLSHLVGKHGIVISPVGANALQCGFVRLDGERWCALPYHQQAISSGEQVEVKAIQGVYLIVDPIKKEEAMP